MTPQMVELTVWGWRCERCERECCVEVGRTLVSFCKAREEAANA